MMRWALLLAAAGAVAPAEAAETPLGNPIAFVRLDDLSATRDRPLFSPSRRPPPAPQPVAAAPPPPPPPPAEAVEEKPPVFDLLGVVLGDGVKMAMLRLHGEGEIRRLHPGDEVQGWRVGRVEPRAVTLEKGDQTQSVALANPDAAAAAPNGAEVAEQPPSDDMPRADEGVQPPPMPQINAQTLARIRRNK